MFMLQIEQLRMSPNFVYNLYGIFFINPSFRGMGKETQNNLTWYNLPKHIREDF